MLDYEDLLELVKKRRSIRNFKPDRVTDEVINKILEVARWAPSGANHQPWEFIVIKDRAIKDRVVAIVQDSMRGVKKMELTREKDLQHPGPLRPVEEAHFKDAPVFIIVVGDPRTRQAQVLEALQSPKSYISSLANAFLYMHLAATALGLGSQWVSTSSQPLPQALIKQELGIPEGYDMYDLFVLGYPDHTPGPRIVRELGEIVHQNHYEISKYRSDAEVKELAIKILQGYPMVSARDKLT